MSVKSPVVANLASSFIRAPHRSVAPVQKCPIPLEKALLLIEAAAAKHNVPVEFVRSIVATESAFNSQALSPKGAMGLMQLMPETAKEYGADPALPAQNVDAGTHYLRVLLDRYRSHRNSYTLAAAAYNAGPGMVDKYRGVPPFRETRGYVARVSAFFHRFSAETKLARAELMPSPASR